MQTALAKLYLSWDKVQRARLGRRATSAGSWSTRTTRCGAAAGRSASTPRDDGARDDQVVDKYDEGPSAALWEIVQTLPKKARAVVVLRYYEELTEAETAELLGISVGTVKSQASRALATLRERAPQDLHPRTSEEER